MALFAGVFIVLFVIGTPIAVALGEPTVSKEAHVVREGLVNRV